MSPGVRLARHHRQRRESLAREVWGFCATVAAAVLWGALLVLVA